MSKSFVCQYIRRTWWTRLLDWILRRPALKLPVDVKVTGLAYVQDLIKPTNPEVGNCSFSDMIAQISQSGAWTVGIEYESNESGP